MTPPADRPTTAWLRRAIWGAVLFLVFLGVAIVVRRTVLLVPVLLNGYHAPDLDSARTAAQFAALDDLFARYPALTLVHIIPGLFFVLLGPFQLSAVLRSRSLQWHRWTGRALLLCGVVVGVSALVMSFGMPSIGGASQATATTLFALLFLFALAKGWWHILHGEIALHREWMIRAFAIGLAVATIRPIVGVFFATSRLSGLTPREFFGIAFWLGFTAHLLAAEVYIHSSRRPMVLESVDTGA